MGTCKFCGKAAGLFSRCHKECRTKHEEGLTRMKGLMQRFFDGAKSAPDMGAIINRNRAPYFLCDEDIALCGIEVLNGFAATLRRPYQQFALDKIKDFIDYLGVDKSLLNRNGELDSIGKRLMEGFLVDYFAQGVPLPQVQRNASSVSNILPLSATAESEAYYSVLNKAASRFMVDGVLSPHEEQLITSYADCMGLNLCNLPPEFNNVDLQKIGQALVLRGLERGIMPKKPIPVPVLLGRGECALWVYHDVTMYQEKVIREFRGGSQGMSFRVCKSVTYRTDSFKGHPIERSSMELVGTGSLVITNKNLIFHCYTASVKIPYSKLVGVTPFSDGFEAHKEEAKPKRRVFQGFDPWFVMNVLSQVNSI